VQAAGGISEEAMENLYQARMSSTQAEAETQAALATETPQQTSERYAFPTLSTPSKHKPRPPNKPTSKKKKGTMRHMTKL
jgi:hypothetical protein